MKTPFKLRVFGWIDYRQNLIERHLAAPKPFRCHAEPTAERLVELFEDSECESFVLLRALRYAKRWRGRTNRSYEGTAFICQFLIDYAVTFLAEDRPYYNPFRQPDAWEENRVWDSYFWIFNEDFTHTDWRNEDVREALMLFGCLGGYGVLMSMFLYDVEKACLAEVDRARRRRDKNGTARTPGSGLPLSFGLAAAAATEHKAFGSRALDGRDVKHVKAIWGCYTEDEQNEIIETYAAWRTGFDTKVAKRKADLASGRVKPLRTFKDYIADWQLPQ